MTRHDDGAQTRGGRRNGRHQPRTRLCVDEYGLRLTEPGYPQHRSDNTLLNDPIGLTKLLSVKCQYYTVQVGRSWQVEGALVLLLGMVLSGLLLFMGREFLEGIA